jgi:hypothetical protein
VAIQAASLEHVAPPAAAALAADVVVVIAAKCTTWGIISTAPEAL